MKANHLALCAVLVVSAGCAKQDGVTRKPIPVRTLTVAVSTSQGASQRLTGNIKALANVPVAFRVGGYVVDAGDQPTLLDAGETVHAGQILARVRQADYLATQQQAAAGVNASQAQVFQATSKVTEAQAALAQAIAGIEEARAKRGSAVAQVSEAQHAVQQAQAALAEARAGKQQANATLEQALAGHEKAQSDFRRAKNLLAARAATQAEYDAAKAQIDASTAQVEQARQAIRGIEAKEQQAQAVIRQATAKVAEAKGQVLAADAAIERLGQSRNAAAAAVNEAHGLVRQANAGLKASSAQQETARLALQDSSLTCPINGTVIARKIEIGALVGPGTPGYIVADTRKVKVTFGVPDADHSLYTLGVVVPFTVDSLGQPFTGVVTSVASSADAATRLFEIELTVDNPKNLLKQGMVAAVTPRAKRSAPAMTVPFTALIGDDTKGQAVFVVIGGKLKKTPVTLGRILGDQVEVLSGLAGGDVVVSEGAGMLTNGDEVEVLR